MAYHLQTGQRFGRLTVVSKDHTNSHGEVVWKCQCDCGNTTYTTGHYLTHGHTQSCGCLVSDRAREVNLTHGETHSKLYRAYTNMMTRCYNPKYKYFHAYGGRGIAVCDEWKGEGGYENFSKWAKANGFSPELTFDRADVNGDYSPSNCRWATMKQQQNNRTNNLRIEYNGEVKTLSEWADHLGVNYAKLQRMLHRNVPIAEAVKKLCG